MPGAVGPWIVINDARANAWKKRIDLNGGDTIKCALALSTSNIAKTMSPATYAALTHEVANGNGYSTGGATASAPTVSGGGGTAAVTADTANITFTAAGGSITARFAILYDSATGYLIAFCLLDSTPADYVIPDGETLTIAVADIFSNQ